MFLPGRTVCLQRKIVPIKGCKQKIPHSLQQCELGSRLHHWEPSGLNPDLSFLICKVDIMIARISPGNYQSHRREYT